MSKVYTQGEYDQLTDGLAKKVGFIILGGVIGVVLAACMDVTGAANYILFSLFFAGVPYAWSKIPMVSIGLISFFIKFIVSVVLGWIITPIALALDITKVVMYKRQEKANAVPENNVV